MLNLERLTLYLRIGCQNVFIDPIDLLDDFSLHLSRLYSFKFYLSTENKKDDLIRYLANNDIKHNYKKLGCEEILDMASFTRNTGTYHVFTVPFEFTLLMSVGNIFPNIVFFNVIDLWIYDIVPFEHEFFLRIARAFPLLKRFYLTTLTTMSSNLLKSSDSIPTAEIVEYPHLVLLDLERTDTNYVEQFLNDNKTHLPCLSELFVFYEQLRIITNDFTREETRRNCGNVKKLCTRREIVGSKHFYTYFPLL